MVAFVECAEEVFPVPKMRVLIAYRPGMMRELLNELVAQEADLESAGNIERIEEIAESVKQFRADCLIISKETLSQQPGLCAELLPQYPHLSILALAPERNSGMLYRNAAQGPCGPIECSEEGILNALRAATPSS